MREQDPSFPPAARVHPYRSVTTPDLLCVVCRRRDYEWPQVCTGDRLSIPRTIDSIDQLGTLRLPGVDERPQADAGQIRVSGGNVDPAIPINITVVDLGAPVDYRPKPDGPDQIGVVSEYTTFWRIAADWAPAIGWAPPPYASAAADWLKSATEAACDHYPGIADSVRELRRLEAVLRNVVTSGDDGKQLIGRCPGAQNTTCGGPIYATTWQDSAECSWCTRRWSRVQWPRLAEMLQAA